MLWAFSRQRYPLDGSEKEVIVSGATIGIGIDMESDHLYWIDISVNTLYRADLDGANKAKILTGIYNAKAIALDTENK